MEKNWVVWYAEMFLWLELCYILSFGSKNWRKTPENARFRPLIPGFPSKNHENWVTSACDSSRKMMDIHF